LYELNYPYKGACIYERSVDLTNGSKAKHLIQINYSKDKILATEYDPEKGFEYSGVNTEYIDKQAYDFGFAYSFTIETFLNANDGNCPAIVNVKRANEVDAVPYMNFRTELFADKKGDNYFIVDVKGVNPLTNEILTLNNITKPSFDFESLSEINTCEDLVGEKIAGYFNVIWKIIKIGIPIILIGFGTIDFVQAIFSGKEDGMKKAQGKFIKRLIIAIAIFLIPTILSLLLDIANNIWGGFGADICGLIF